MSPSIPEPVYPLAAVRRLALHTQGLATPLGAEPEPGLEAIYKTVENLGCVQIDTLQMVRRSQYLVLWSRLGSYDPADLDRLIYDPGQRRLFEYWKHAASIIPLNEYRYQLPYMRFFREGNHQWGFNWLHEPGNAELADQVLEEVRQRGPLRVSDFEHDGLPRGAWWDWTPAKHALEHLYNTGDLMIANRVKFQRAYDLRERVLPDWVDTSEPTLAERNRFRLEQAVRALGICEPAQAAEYAYLKRGEARPHLDELLAAGALVPVQADLGPAGSRTLIVQRANLPLLERAASGDLEAGRTTFLSPFDSLFWARGRDQLFWGFSNVLEAYKPPAARIWGYFCLPILHRDRLVGRFDPKLERRSGLLRLKSLSLDPGVKTDDELVAGVATAMRDFLAFHNAAELVIERSQPAEFSTRLLNAL